MESSRCGGSGVGHGDCQVVGSAKERKRARSGAEGQEVACSEDLQEGRQGWALCHLGEQHLRPGTSRCQVREQAAAGQVGQSKPGQKSRTGHVWLLWA